MKGSFFMRACLLLALCGSLLAGCDRGDVKWNEPTTNVTVSMKGCQSASGRVRNDLVLNIDNAILPDGRVQCTITTIRTTKTSQ